MKFPIEQIRKDFPILAQQARGRPLVYLDNGATSQKPNSVIEATARFYRSENANVHRGVYQLSENASEAFESVRGKVARFLGLKHPESEREIVFTSGTTTGLNLIASSWGRKNIQSGDTLVVTRMEHHANFVPWQALAKEKGATFEIVELTADGKIDFDSFSRAMEKKPKLVALTLMSNVLGTINPVAELTRMARKAGALVVVDGAQAVAQMPVDLTQFPDIDFFAFSGHKMCAPTGVGVLWGKRARLEELDPYQYGGDMILVVRDQESEWNEVPWRFEAGTPNIAGVIGLGVAIDYLESIGMKAIQEYEHHLSEIFLDRLALAPWIKLFGPRKSSERGSLFSFALEGVHPHDIATYFDHEGIAVRAGHHCAQPLMSYLKTAATTRVSFAFYNTAEEIEIFFKVAQKTRDFFAQRSGRPK